MTAKLTWTQAVALMGNSEPRLQQYCKGDTSGSHPNFDLALAAADGKMRSRISFRYTSASWDALDSTTTPGYVQSYLFSLMLGEVTSRDDARPDSIGIYAGLAAGWLEDVVKGAAVINELVAAGTGGVGIADNNVTSNLPVDRVFSRNSSNSNQDFNHLDVPIFSSKVNTP